MNEENPDRIYFRRFGEPALVFINTLREFLGLKPIDPYEKNRNRHLTKSPPCAVISEQSNGPSTLNKTAPSDETTDVK